MREGEGRPTGERGGGRRRGEGGEGEEIRAEGRGRRTVEYPEARGSPGQQVGKEDRWQGALAKPCRHIVF